MIIHSAEPVKNEFFFRMEGKIGWIMMGVRRD
jgi:hypothetical protein